MIEAGANVNDKDYNEETQLMHALKEGHIDIVKLLLLNGAKINAKDKYGNTALILSSRSGYLEIVEKLLEKGANICHRDESYKTALDYISENFKNSQTKSDKNKFADTAYLMIGRMADEYTQLFKYLNKNLNTSKDLNDIVHNHINLLFNLQKLPRELFEKVIESF